MTPRTGVSTPQAFRDDLFRQRGNFESEQWDDYSNVIFSDVQNADPTYTGGQFDSGVAHPDFLCYLDIPCPISSRLHVQFSAQLISGGGGTVDVQFGIVASVALPATNDPRNRSVVANGDTWPISGFRTIDVPSGMAIVAAYIIVYAGSVPVRLQTNHLTVRRGRQP